MIREPFVNLTHLFQTDARMIHVRKQMRLAWVKYIWGIQPQIPDADSITFFPNRPELRWNVPPILNSLSVSIILRSCSRPSSKLHAKNFLYIIWCYVMIYIYIYYAFNGYKLRIFFEMEPRPTVAEAWVGVK